MTINPRSMTPADLLALAACSTTTDVPTAGRAFDLSPNVAYALVAQGKFPCRVLRLGRKLRVPTADLLMCLGIGAEPAVTDVITAEEIS